MSADLGRLKIDRNRPAAGAGRALKWTAGLAVAAAIFIGAVYLYGRSMAGTDVRVARVEVVGGSGQTSAITANGYVVARTHASVSSRVAGRLASLLVEEGSVVRRGELLAQIENDDYQASVAQAVADSLSAVAALGEAEANRGQLARDLERSRSLVAKELEAARVAEDLEAQLAAADARVAVQRAEIASAAAGVGVARANLANTFIRAPFDGTVLRKDAEVGEVVAPVAAGGGLTRGAVVTMADLETLEVEVDVNEAYIAQIVDAQATRIVLDAYPSASFPGEVRQIVPTADRQRATVQVKVSITGKDPRILPEMSARVEFLDAGVDSGAPMRILVPAEAIQAEGGGTWVWVVREGRVTRTAIEAGPVSGDSREVRTGLSGGESIVLDPPGQLADGERVNVITTP